MIADVYEKKFDPSSKTWFYFNKNTGESHWEKPLGLRSEDINISSRTAEVAKKAGMKIDEKNVFIRKEEPVVHEKRYTAADLSTDEAATILQQMYRRKIARRRLNQLASKRYKKCFDPTTKRIFYFNLKTQESLWKIPAAVNEDDLKLTPRSEKLAIEAKAIVPPKPKTPRFTADTLSDEEAALHIQGIWRARKARKLLRKMIADVYVKKYDHASKKFYYVNKKSGESFWKKPLGLHSEDLVASARTEAQAVKDGVIEKPHHTPRVHAKDLSVEDAAIMIQGAYRRKIARRRLHQMASKVYTKSFDEKTGKFYFTNTKTGESVWDPPKVLGDEEEVEMTPRSKEQYELLQRKLKEEAIRHHTPRFKASDLSLEDAARHLQQAWRSSRARKKLRHLMKHQYTKHYDAKNKAYYYRNTKTGESLWKKPKLLKVDDDLDLTPRSAEIAHADGLDVPPQPKTVRFHSWNLTPDEAAIHVRKLGVVLKLVNMCNNY